jgi:hypothetical protein
MQDKTLVVLGHIESESYVIRDSFGDVVTSLSLMDLRSQAKEYNIKLIDVGCDTARTLGNGNEGIGVAGSFNSLAAIKRIIIANEKSRNFSEFLFNMSSSDLPIVIDYERLLKTDIDVPAHVMSDAIGDEGIYESVGTINITVGMNIANNAVQWVDSYEEVELVNPDNVDENERIKVILRGILEEK